MRFTQRSFTAAPCVLAWLSPCHLSPSPLSLTSLSTFPSKSLCHQRGGFSELPPGVHLMLYSLFSKAVIGCDSSFAFVPRLWVDDCVHHTRGCVPGDSSPCVPSPTPCPSREGPSTQGTQRPQGDPGKSPVFDASPLFEASELGICYSSLECEGLVLPLSVRRFRLRTENSPP